VPASRIEDGEGENEKRWTDRRVPEGKIGDREDRRKDAYRARKTMRQSGREWESELVAERPLESYFKAYS